MTPKTIIKRTILLAGAVFALSLVTTSGVWAACSDPAAKGVDWSGCDLSGVNLYDVDLYGVNLEGANLAGANLTETILASAIWTDGRKCIQNSIGACN